MQVTVTVPLRMPDGQIMMQAVPLPPDFVAAKRECECLFPLCLGFLAWRPAWRPAIGPITCDACWYSLPHTSRPSTASLHPAWQR